ncbi:MAG: type IV pilus secretin PilQ, partial [Deltaproteobacteria bacterium]|nr:type IV pilus secretin PilQ [Deltaproteobacteria bacterium]
MMPIHPRWRRSIAGTRTATRRGPKAAAMVMLSLALAGGGVVAAVEEIPGIGIVAPAPTPASSSAAASTPSKVTTSNPRIDATAPAGAAASASGRGSQAGTPAATAAATGGGPGRPGTAAPAQGAAGGGGGGPASVLGILRSGRRRYSGRRIDLDFKGADIHNILRLLSDVGQVNIVTSDDVKGEVTIKMRNVPWDQALDVNLRSKLLGQVREGNLIRVAPLAILEKELEQEIARQKQLADVMPTETRIIAVSYAEAKMLQDRAHDLLTARGRISVDERTNQLIVSDVAANLNLVEDLVRSLDSQTSQVVIEARIVEARSNFVRQLGVQWGGSGFRDAAHGNATGLVFPSDVAVGGGASDATAPRGLVNLAPAASPDFAVNLPATVGAGSGGALGLMLGSVGGAFNLNLRLSAMENTGQVRILSSPRISTMDNIEASIEQGVSIPISIISAQGIQTIFVDAKLNLTVKPHVTNDGTIIMHVHV